MMISALKRVLPTSAKRRMKQSKVVHRLYRDGRGLRARPLFMNIELTTHCNLSCRMCSHDLLPPEDLGHMPFDRFRRIVDQAEAFPGIVFLLFGLGEPLLYPRLPAAMDYVHHRFPKAPIGLSTNAHFLRGDMAEAVLNCDKVTISLNAGSPETYRWLHRSDRYEEVTDDITSFLELRSRSPFYKEEKKPFVSLCFLETERTLCEQDSFRRRWEPLLGDGGEVYVKRLVNWGGAVDVSALHRKRGDTASRYPCIYLWNSLSVDIHGNVYPCMQCYGRRRSSALCMGNVGDQTLAGLYCSDSLAEARRLHLADRYSQIEDCRECDIYRLHRNIWFRLPLPLSGRRWL